MQHPIAVVVPPEVLFGEVRYPELEVFCESNNVTFFKDGTCRFAAIRAIKAIDLFKGLFVCRMKPFIQVLRTLLFPAGKEAANLFPIPGRCEQLLSELSLQWGSKNWGLDTKEVSVNV